MKTALVTMLNEDFVKGYVAFIKSFMYYNPWFNYRIIILDLGLSDETKDFIKSFYKKISFKNIKKQNYQDVNFSATDPRLRDTYYKLEIFNMFDLDRVVFIDMDTIVLGDIKELFNCGQPIAAVKAYFARKDILVNEINSGVLVVNKQFLNPETYRGLVELARQGFSMPDQKAINLYFDSKISYFNKAYNVEKRMLHTKRFKHILNNIKILHYVGEKPWNDKVRDSEKNYEQFEKLWREWHGKDFNQESTDSNTRAN